MLDRLIRWSLAHRVMVLLSAGLLLVVGGVWLTEAPVDVFPDLSAPTVTVITEAHGMAPEEVEVLITFPLEAALNGGPGVRRVRSVSAAGISVIWVEFEWGQEIYRTRQVVGERIQGVEMPLQVEPPVLGPISSIMGEITFIALTSDTVSQLELRRLSEVVVRRALLAVPGVSQVVPIGGEDRQFQVEIDPQALRQRNLGLEDVISALEGVSRSPAAGFHVDQGQEYLVRGMARARSAEDLAAAVIRHADGFPVTVGDVADVHVGAAPRRGTASYGTAPAVVLSVQKQPEVNTLELTRDIDGVLEDVARTLPEGVVIERENFRQADFIEVAVRNVARALLEGGILVVLILFAFLGNARTTVISVAAIPLSLVAGLGLIALLGGSINTMTLGGMTIAIGALVDDAIIDVENILRRLREAREGPDQKSGTLEIVRAATSEVRGAILFATLIIVVVFVPLILLPGVEGRLLRPLGFAYVAGLSASFVVSLTVTPVLCSLLLPQSKALDRESALLRWAERVYRSVLDRALELRGATLVASLLLLAAAIAVVPSLDRSFLPEFNEGALTVGVASAPGIRLDDSDRLGRQVEEALLQFPEVVSTSRRTGRAEKDEHVQGVNRSELEVVLRPGRPKEELLAEMRRAVATIPGVVVTFGQPISHRIDHMISGTRTNLAVKIFGPDLAVLRALGTQVEDVLTEVAGIVDVSNQEQGSVPQLLIDFDREALARYNLSMASASTSVEALFQGAEVGQIVEDGLVSGVVVVFPEALRDDRSRLSSLPVMVRAGQVLRLGQLADVRFDLGPSLVRRENAGRVAVVTANVAGADLAGTVERVRERMNEEVDLPKGYRIVYGGQFEEAERSVERLGWLSLLILGGMYGLLYLAFRNHRDAAIVSVNLPLSLIGGVLAVWLTGEALSVATLVGFVTLFGIATRNGVLLVSRYQTLLADGLSRAEAVRQGSLERLAPILMTALTAGLALLPLVLAGNRPGNEIQSPMGVVILGGLLSSTFLNLIVVPVLFDNWGRSERSVAYESGSE
jgi:CzcA family heavy metal efflux pump